MKKLILFIMGAVCAVTGLQAQTTTGPVRVAFGYSPVSWQYHVAKTSDNIYELNISAKIQQGWHLYSQHQPEGAIAIPTRIKFNKEPSIIFKGRPKEVGEREKSTIKSLGISAYQYTGKVDFVQTIKIKGTVPVSIAGTVTY